MTPRPRRFDLSSACSGPARCSGHGSPGRRRAGPSGLTRAAVEARRLRPGPRSLRLEAPVRPASRHGSCRAQRSMRRRACKLLGAPRRRARVGPRDPIAIDEPLDGPRRLARQRRKGFDHRPRSRDVHARSRRDRCIASRLSRCARPRPRVLQQCLSKGARRTRPPLDVDAVGSCDHAVEQAAAHVPGRSRRSPAAR